MSRAQTTMDFATGVSIFLVTVAFAFAFVPGIITPFTGTNVGDPVTANRLADGLASDRLADPGAPYTLDRDRVESFFTDGTDLSERLAVPEFRSANVTLENRSGVASVAGNPRQRATRCRTARTSPSRGAPSPSTASATNSWCGCGSDAGASTPLEGVAAALIVVVAVAFTLQATAVTPLTASTASQHIETQHEQAAAGLLETASADGSLSATLRHWNATRAGFWNASRQGTTSAARRTPRLVTPSRRRSGSALSRTI